MRYLFCLLVALLVIANTNAQKTVRMDAVKGSDFGVTYNLPKTVLEITTEYSKTTKKAGEFYMYAERYLNIGNPIVENEVKYTLDKLDATPIGVPNTLYAYLVEFRPNSATAYITLTQDGMICAINDDYIFPMPLQEVQGQAKKKEVNVHQYFSEEMLRSGSTAKQAELIAKQIYRLRESRNEILTGESDNMPPDGDAYKLVMQQLDEQETVLTGLFVGTETVETMKKVQRIDINNNDIDAVVIARFSQKMGMVEANDLAGEAITLSLKAHNPTPPLILTLKETKEREKKFSKGIIYNVPAKATLQLEFKHKILVDKNCDIVQFGTQDVLEHKQFGDKNNPLKVVFHPDLGSIKQTGLAR